jgi:hypothetical protein
LKSTSQTTQATLTFMAHAQGTSSLCPGLSLCLKKAYNAPNQALFSILGSNSIFGSWIFIWSSSG